MSYRNNFSQYVPYQPDNPTDSERYALARYAFEQSGRPGDYEYVMRLLAAPEEITSIMKPGAMRNIRVGIIGGGLAGLSAAYELRKLGCDIAVFDPLKDRVGGRVYTYYFDSGKSLYGEFGPMRIPVTHEATWHYIKLFGLPTRPFVQSNENGIIYLRNVRVRNDFEGINVMKYIYPRYKLKEWEKRMTWQALLYYGYESHLLNATPQVRSEILKLQQVYSPQTILWDALNNRQMQEKVNLSNEAISLISNFTPLAGETLYNNYIDYIQERYSIDLSFLYEIPGGVARLPQAFYSSFKEVDSCQGIPGYFLGKVDYRAGSWVSGIHRQPEGTGVVLAHRNNADEKPTYENFDYVVCAIPFSALRAVDIYPLFSPGKMQAIREVEYINAQKTLFLCRKRFWEEGGPHERIVGGASYTDLPVTSLWYPSDHIRNNIKNGGNTYNCYQSVLSKQCSNSIVPPAEEPGVLLAYSFSMEATRLANMKQDVRFEEMKHEIEELHGLPRNYLDDIITDYKTVNWNTEPWFRNALCYFTPEQKRIFSTVMATPEYEGRVFMAGEHISPKHRWMQGALESGMRAANGIAQAVAVNSLR